jgi:pre-mRNA-processing factor 39
LDLFGDAKSIRKASTRHTTLFSCKRSILPSKKRKADDAVVSDRDKFAKTGSVQSATGTDPNASNPPVWPATSETSGHQWGASYAQQVKHSFKSACFSYMISFAALIKDTFSKSKASKRHY